MEETKNKTYTLFATKSKLKKIFVAKKSLRLLSHGERLKNIDHVKQYYYPRRRAEMDNKNYRNPIGLKRLILTSLRLLFYGNAIVIAIVTAF